MKFQGFREQNFSGYGYALLATVIWSGNFIVARGVANEIGRVSLAFFRWAVASLVLLPFAWSGLKSQRGEIWKKPEAPCTDRVFGCHGFQHAHLHCRSPDHGVESFPHRRVHARVHHCPGQDISGEAITPQRFAGVVFAITGVVALATQGDFSRLAGLRFNTGDLWMVVATFLFARLHHSRAQQALDPPAP